MKQSPHIENREKLVQFLRSEMLGPCLVGEERDFSDTVAFETWKDAEGPWIQKESRDEVITRGTPVNRYGIGVLYPIRITHQEMTASDSETDFQVPESDMALSTAAAPEIETIGSGNDASDEPDDFDLSLVNTLKPSSMGISFLAELPDSAVMTVSVKGGRYLIKDVTIQDSQRQWFLRAAVDVPEVQFSGKRLKSSGMPPPERIAFDNGMILSVECFSRQDIYSPHKSKKNRRLITVCLVNRTVRKADTLLQQSELTLFQATFTVHISGGKFAPYPEAAGSLEAVHQTLSEDDRERASFKLLYQNNQTYAIGHGCAATWNDQTPEAPASITADPFPEYELPSITPDAKRADGTDIRISMSDLADLEDGMESLLQDFLSEYQHWISLKKVEAGHIPAPLQSTAQRHIENAETCLQRMQRGLDFIRNDPVAAKAFQLANKAILLQQITERQKRLYSFDETSRKNTFTPSFKNIDLNQLPAGTGCWRAFQIAFILTSLRSSVLNCEDREDVELIWFPTGGGKTEAYLGLAAFVMFYRRLRDPIDDGVHVLMRYTLRLLTTQQFQRATRLLCAMEVIRQKNGNMGKTPFSVGIWVGSANTPNTCQDAQQALNRLKKTRYAENPFVVRQCPWCGAEMGSKSIRHNKSYKIMVLGYSSTANSVIFKCPDKKCPFYDSLPIHVIDEEIYKHHPSLIIGTVDKFAMLAWVPKAGSLFGLNSDGKREKSPPSLIIQDELHLISGPLGTMVGLYETVMEALCTENTGDTAVKPKIVCSTATIRRYQDQIKALFARKNAFLFPPSGLDAGDSFFARYAIDEKGKRLPGRRYVGIYAPGLPSIQTLEVRAFSALLMGAMQYEQSTGRDPWWTLMLFFNSLRELGGALSLFQTDIPGAVKAVAARNRLTEWRHLNILELTSRMSNEEVPKALEKLEKAYSGSRGHAVDVCLASSIIEVGIDVDRLSLMSIVGQPKTIAQYIQVSGRIGRKWQERPGLVVTLFSNTKPRDRSFFEKFQSTHSQLYAQVEPTSVTPFSPPVIDRALHALFAIYLRLMGSEAAAEAPGSVTPELLDRLRAIVEERVRFVDSTEMSYVLNKFDKRIRQFNKWQRSWWFKQNEQSDSLLRRYETWVTEKIERTSWATPTSMRNVDAECQMDITDLYNQVSEEEY